MSQMVDDAHPGAHGMDGAAANTTRRIGARRASRWWAWPGAGWLSTALGCLVLCVALSVSGCQGRASAKASPTVDLSKVVASYSAERARASASASAAAAAGATASMSVSLSPEAAASRQAALSTPLPERLAGMDENSPQGAAQSARYFLKLYTYAFATGDTSQIEAMSEDECVFCNSVIGDARKVHELGGWADHWDYEVKAVRFAHPAEGHTYSLVELDLVDPGTRQYNADGSSQENEGTDLTLKLLVYQVNGQWAIHEGDHKE